ncbi:unnamed protein product, partial [marine sediment metagenome]
PPLLLSADKKYGKIKAIMNCQYSTPINLGTEEVPDWEYSELTCEFSQL